jgi:hypothetical protein
MAIERECCYCLIYILTLEFAYVLITSSCLGIIGFMKQCDAELDLKYTDLRFLIRGPYGNFRLKNPTLRFVIKSRLRNLELRDIYLY